MCSAKEKVNIPENEGNGVPNAAGIGHIFQNEMVSLW